MDSRFKFDAGAKKVAVFTTLAWITTIVLMNVLPRIPTLILLTKSIVIFTILPTANYIILFMAVRHQNSKVQDMVSSQQLRGILTTREESYHEHVYRLRGSCPLCDSKINSHTLI